MTTLARKAFRGECLKCGHDRWRVHRRIRGWQTLTRVEVRVDAEWGFTDIMDVMGDDETDVDDIHDETTTCENCDTPLDIYAYREPLEARTHQVTP